MTGPIFGFIERKADFASLLAVVVSTAALITQVYWFLLGPEVAMIAPQQVFMNVMERDRVRFVVPVTFRNQAVKQYSEVITDINLTMELPNSDLPKTMFRWRSYVEFRPLNGKNPIIFTDIRHPIFVPGASSVSNEAEFTQEVEQCVREDCEEDERTILIWDEFEDAVEQAEIMVLTVVATGLEEARYQTTCTVTIDREFVDLIKQYRPWHAPPCIEPFRAGLQ